jgi:hypothetical protein
MIPWEGGVGRRASFVSQNRGQDVLARNILSQKTRNLKIRPAISAGLAIASAEGAAIQQITKELSCKIMENLIGDSYAPTIRARSSCQPTGKLLFQ